MKYFNTFESNKELKLMFMNIINSKTPSEDLLKLDQMGILNDLLPELVALKGVDNIDGNRHKDNFYHTLQVVKNTSDVTNNPYLIMVAILHDFGKAKTKRYDKNLGWTFHHHEVVGSKMVEQIFKRFDLPIDKLEYVEKLVELHGHVKELCVPNVSDAALRRFKLDIGNDLDDLLLFSKCDMTTKNETKRQINIKSINDLKNKIINLEKFDKVRIFEPPITGQEIMDYFNLKPGREVGLIKKQLKDEILSGNLDNNKELVFKRMIEIGSEFIKSDK